MFFANLNLSKQHYFGSICHNTSIRQLISVRTRVSITSARVRSVYSKVNRSTPVTSITCKLSIEAIFGSIDHLWIMSTCTMPQIELLRRLTLIPYSQLIFRCFIEIPKKIILNDFYF
jgi:hypothetical protein